MTQNYLAPSEARLFVEGVLSQAAYVNQLTPFQLYCIGAAAALYQPEWSRALLASQENWDEHAIRALVEEMVALVPIQHTEEENDD